MSEVIIKPIYDEIIKLGGEFKLNTKVERLIYSKKKVHGVVLSSADKLYAKDIVMAVDINNAKKLLKDINNKYTKKILAIPMISAVTIQIELRKRVMPKDRVTFTPLSDLIASFTEESKSTFKKSKGRLSIIMANPDTYIKYSNLELLDEVIKEFKKLGIDIEREIIAYRVVRHANKFYSFKPYNDHFRPSQKTKIKGLILAGDYTRQKFYATMEGAVISGIKASRVILRDI